MSYLELETFNLPLLSILEAVVVFGEGQEDLRYSATMDDAAAFFETVLKNEQEQVEEADLSYSSSSTGGQHQQHGKQQHGKKKKSWLAKGKAKVEEKDDTTRTRRTRFFSVFAAAVTRYWQVTALSHHILVLLQDHGCVEARNFILREAQLNSTNWRARDSDDSEEVKSLSLLLRMLEGDAFFYDKKKADEVYHVETDGPLSSSTSTTSTTSATARGGGGGGAGAQLSTALHSEVLDSQPNN